MDDPDKFLKDLEDKGNALAVRWKIAQLRKKLDVALHPKGQEEKSTWCPWPCTGFHNRPVPEQPDVEQTLVEITWEEAAKVFEKADSVDELAEAEEKPMEVIRRLQEKAYSRQFQVQEGVQATWSNLFLVTGAALWINTDHVKIKPCVGYDHSMNMTISFGLYTFEDEFHFTLFVAICHLVSLSVILLLLWLVFVAAQRYHVDMQKKYIITIAAVMLAWTVSLTTYEAGGEGSDDSSAWAAACEYLKEAPLSESTMSSKIFFCQTPVGLGILSFFRKGFARATQSWLAPIPRESTETGWCAASMRRELIIVS